MGIFGKNKYNVNFISLPQQVSKNKIDIENLQKIIKQAYKTTSFLTSASTSVDLDKTNITDVTITSGWLIDPTGLLFQISSILDNLVYISYWASLRGETGLQGPQGPQGTQGKRGFGFYTTQQQILSTGTTEVEYGDIIGYDNPQIGDFVISENEQSTGYYGRITSLATLTTTIEYIGTLKGEKGMNYTGTWASGGEYYIDDVATYNGSTYICISNINGGTVNPDADATHWELIAKAGDTDLQEHYIYISTKQDNTIQDINNIGLKFYCSTYRVTKKGVSFSLDDLFTLLKNYNNFKGILKRDNNIYEIVGISFYQTQQYARIEGIPLFGTSISRTYFDIAVKNFTTDYLFMSDYKQTI